MSPSKHVLASAATSVIFYGLTKSVSGTLTCFLSGIFIDIDHVFDFWIAKRKFLFTYRELYQFFDREKAGKVHLIFHSYELLLTFWAVLFFCHLGMFWLGIAVGCTVHMLFDQWLNPLRPRVYFLLYRIKHGFTKESTFTDEEFAKLD